MNEIGEATVKPDLAAIKDFASPVHAPTALPVLVTLHKRRFAPLCSILEPADNV
ncbi:MULTISPECIES: hypothetical protein [unclassified Mesorhizobium]|uniref:hypothetical protein n=1 Tax=unclassified Mesorhizobium TaxID=325217 RepID=UPI001675E3CD|nr:MULTISPECIES: hypothetical protein [unclassified Mesorhizobium]